MHIKNMNLPMKLLIFLAFLSQLQQGNQITVCPDTMALDQSHRCCEGAPAAAIVTKNDLSYFIAEMRQRNLSSVWTGLKRKLTQEWTWIDRSTSAENSLLAGTKTARCALLDLNRKSLEPEICAARGHGHICQKSDCQSCSDIGAFSSVCRKIGDSCYIYHCDNKNFDMAMAACVDVGENLARIPENYTLMLGEQKYCQTYWIGLRREEWLPTYEETRARSVSLWKPGEPIETGNCSFMHWDGQAFRWKVAKCTDQHHLFCGKKSGDTLSAISTESIWMPFTFSSHDAYTTVQGQGKSVSGSPGWLVGMIVGVILIVVVFILVVVVGAVGFFRRKRESHGQEIEMTAGSEASQGLLDKGPKTKHLRRRLAKSLLESHRKLELWSFQDEIVQMNLDDIYTDMTWRTSEGLHHQDSDDQYHYTDIFKPDKDGFCSPFVLVQGEAGCGKTTFVKKMLVDWSRGVLNFRIRLRREDTLSHTFKYIIPIFLRDIRDNEQLQSIFERQLNIDSITASWLVTDIRVHSERTLIVLEGYDEFRERKCSDIIAIKNRQMFNDVKVLITCRSPYSSYLSDPQIKSKVDLHGFSGKSVRLYIKKYSTKNSNMPAGLYEKINSSDELEGISKIPAILLLMCILWNYEGVLSNNITGFYKDFVSYMCERYAKKFFPCERFSRSDIFKKFSGELMKLGMIAFQGLKGDNINLSFSSADINKIVDEYDRTTLRLGFLRKSKTTLDELYYSFHHKTVQEYFTAFYIVNCGESERLGLLMSFCSSKHRHQESKQILRFVAGLGDYVTRYHVDKALSGWTEDATKDRIAFLLTYLDENLDAKFELPTIVEIDMSAFHYASTYTRFFKMSADHLKELNMYVVHLSVLGYLQFLTAPNLRRLSVSLSNDLPVLSPQKELGENVKTTALLPKFPLQQIAFKNFKGEHGRLIFELCKGLDSVETLESLDLSSCALSSESIEELKNALPRLLEKRGLHFGNNDCDSRV